ncbi:hypothetical protein S615_004581 [Salmonella enterica subsp. arizonae]|nr:hypothetical protein [Salmonella enterica subsp. arizonae]
MFVSHYTNFSHEATPTVSRRLMKAFLAVSENFPAAAGCYRERAVSGPLLSYTPSRM